MKRRFVIVIAAAVILAFTACEKKAENNTEVSAPSVEEVSITADVETETEVESEPEVTIETGVGMEEDDSIVAIVDMEDYRYGDSEATLYELRGEEIIGEYKVPVKYVRGSYFVKGSNIFCVFYEEDETGNGNNWAYGAYNYKTGSEFVFDRGTGYYGSIDIRDGDVIVTKYEPGLTKGVESRYDARTFSKISKDVNYSCNSHTVLNYGPAGEFNSTAISTEMANSGHYMGYKYLDNIEGDSFKEYFLFGDRYATPLPGIEGEGTFADIFFYNDKNIVYQFLDADGNYKVNNYDIDTGEKTLIAEGRSEILGNEDGIVYFMETDEKTISVCDKTIYAYDVKNNRITTLYTATFRPGSRGDKPIGEVIISNGNIYARYNDGEVKDWCLLKDGEFKQLGVNPKVYGFSKFGTVECLEKSVECIFCGERIGEFVGEYIELSDSLSDKAQAITKSIKKDVQNECDRLIKEDLYYSQKADDCESNGHGYYYGEVTYEEFITGIRILGRYMAVDKEGYWYGGGAHGMESMEGFLYNLDTGKKTAFSEVFPGSEKDFKTIVAEKTKEDFLSEDSYNGYDWDDEETVYEHAYDFISFKNCPVMYGEEGITVVYPPYEMGCYASGYVIIFISYDDLGITAFSVD